MIITRLTLENFGVFRGEITIDLSPRLSRDEPPPIILFGGKNGAGKTTILEAIRLCLYGRNALGNRVRKSDYDTYLQERIHRPADNTLLHHASVQLGFEFVHAGVRNIYDAQRTWRVEGRTVQEQLFITKDGWNFQEIDSAHWDEFLRDLIPPGIANLFFFDGEQIQALAESSSEAEALETAVGGLLNLNLVDRLKTDLDLYIRQQERQDLSRLQERADALHNQHIQFQEKYEEELQSRADLQGKLEDWRKRTERARQNLVREGAQFIQERNALEAEQKDIERQQERTRNAMRELANGLLPFAIAPSWSRALHSRLKQEAQHEQSRLAIQVRRGISRELKQALLNDDVKKRLFPKAALNNWQQFISEFDALLGEDEIEDGTSGPLHAFSTQRREELLATIESVLNRVPQQIEELGKHLDELESRQRKVTQNLRQVPDEALANPLIEEFQRLSEETGIFIHQLAGKDESIRQLENQLAEIERLRKKVWLDIAAMDDVDARIERAAKVQIILDEYKARITQIKLDELEERVAEYFNRLCRKQHLVRRVVIDPDRYRVTLFTENGEILPKSSLSAGERQLYAMSLLWALRSVSGRQLPIIVDTPMGRLDSDHRYTLLTEFFPYAAHQLILLSTDTELDSEAYALLAPAVSRTYLLSFNMERNCTEIEERYFEEAEASL